MLFVMVCQARPGTFNERVARRAQWEYASEGMKPVAEYWLQTDDPSLISVVEADDPASFTEFRSRWDDILDVKLFPAQTAEEVLEAYGKTTSS